MKDSEMAAGARLASVDREAASRTLAGAWVGTYRNALVDALAEIDSLRQENRRLLDLWQKEHPIWVELLRRPGEAMAAYLLADDGGLGTERHSRHPERHRHDTSPQGVTVPPLMKCGCVATGTKGHGGPPVCVTHYGLTPDAEVVAEQQPNFEGRVARCAYCGREEPSSTDLPFFIYTPAKAKDEFYCGCRGWE